MTNQSPWLHQLNRTRPIASISKDYEADVAIIGGGIAGISTAYFILKNTNKKVVLAEANKIAHGATGHNGGFLASYFERTFKSMVEEFGISKAAAGQQAMDYSWNLLEEMHREANLQTPIWQFTGYTACASLEEALVYLEDGLLKQQAGISRPKLLLAEEVTAKNKIPEKYASLYTITPHQKILSLLETEDAEYIAILPERKGCMNSAVFSEELIHYLLDKYENRFTLTEGTPIRRLVLKESYAILDITKNTQIIAKEVVLCTNGFEKISIVNTAGRDINKKFHYLVRGIVGYMAGYTEEQTREPAEISYLPKKSAHGADIYTEEPYFYLTRRPFDTTNQNGETLICIGGPEALMDDTNNYQEEHPFPEEAKTKIDNFLRYTYKHGPADKISYKFLWHGLMGFTPNSIRLIGPEPNNPILYYNLGCNGVGLLPSIYGGYKISQHITGEKLEPSMFDPKK